MTQPIAILDVEVTTSPEAIPVPMGAAGAAVVVRKNGRLAGFHMAVSACAIPRAVLEELAEDDSAAPPPPRLLELPPLTIAVCTRNRPVELERMLRSVREVCGGSPAVDVLIVDNAPESDVNERIARKFPAFRYIVEPRPGLSFARNLAIDEARGDYIAYLDDDAVLDRGWLSGFQEALSSQPNAASFSGPVLPYELVTEAQILMEGRGGMGHSFRRIVYTDTLPGSPLYPCGEACIGIGANMIFRRDVVENLGRFDEALGSGMPSQSCEDHDMFYRLVRSGYHSVYEPRLAIFHQHRRDMEGFRRQVRSWSVGTVAYMLKAWRLEPEQRVKIFRFLVRLGIRKVGGAIVSVLGLRRFPWPAKLASVLSLRRYHWPPELAIAELQGYFLGFSGVYQRSQRIVKKARSHEAATVL